MRYWFLSIIFFFYIVGGKGCIHAWIHFDWDIGDINLGSFSIYHWNLLILKDKVVDGLPSPSWIEELSAGIQLGMGAIPDGALVLFIEITIIHTASYNVYTSPR